MGSVYELVGAQEMIYSTKELSWELWSAGEKNAENYEMYGVFKNDHFHYKCPKWASIPQLFLFKFIQHYYLYLNYFA